MEIHVLERLIPLLASHNVLSFKDRDLELQFHHSKPVVKQELKSADDPLAAPPPSVPPVVSDSLIPTGVVEGDINEFQEILEHSSRSVEVKYDESNHPFYRVIS